MILLVGKPKTKFTFCTSFCRRRCRRARCCDQWMFISLVGGTIFLRYKYKWYNLPRNWLVPFAIPNCWWWCFFPCLWPLYDLCATCAVLVLWSWRLKEEINDVAQEGIQLEEHWFQKAENIRDSKNGPKKIDPNWSFLGEPMVEFRYPSQHVPATFLSPTPMLLNPPSLGNFHRNVATQKSARPIRQLSSPALVHVGNSIQVEELQHELTEAKSTMAQRTPSVTDYQRLLRKMVRERLHINSLVGFEVIWSDNYDFLWLGSWSISPYPNDETYETWRNLKHEPTTTQHGPMFDFCIHDFIQLHRGQAKMAPESEQLQQTMAEDVLISWPVTGWLIKNYRGRGATWLTTPEWQCYWDKVIAGKFMKNHWDIEIRSLHFLPVVPCPCLYVLQGAGGKAGSLAPQAVLQTHVGAVLHPKIDSDPKEMKGQDQMDQMQPRAEASHVAMRSQKNSGRPPNFMVLWCLCMYCCDGLWAYVPWKWLNMVTLLFKIAYPILRSTHSFVASRPSERTSRAADVKEICNKRGIYAECGPSSWKYLHYTSEALLQDWACSRFFLKSVIVCFL